MGPNWLVHYWWWDTGSYKNSPSRRGHPSNSSEPMLLPLRTGPANKKPQRLSRVLLSWKPPFFSLFTRRVSTLTELERHGLITFSAGVKKASSSPRHLLSLLRDHGLPYRLPLIAHLIRPILSKAADEAHYPKDRFFIHSLGERLSLPISHSGAWMLLTSSSLGSAWVEHLVEPVIAAFDLAYTASLVRRNHSVIRHTHRSAGTQLRLSGHRQG